MEEKSKSQIFGVKCSDVTDETIYKRLGLKFTWGRCATFGGDKGEMRVKGCQGRVNNNGQMALFTFVVNL